ncbi:unnamed protein product [Brassica rapa]|uniref:Uncharacterized protein n=2 Tax=Brassica TaxID=3705 RepID=A0A8D9HCX4_BRACM|nr:unnamed protein product [Brassica napus]CAG7897121.1 unnamed protein product [Brassica rapa]
MAAEKRRRSFLPLRATATRCRRSEVRQVFSLFSFSRDFSDNGMSTPTSGTVSATTVEIPKSASFYVKEVSAKSPTKSASMTDSGGDETDLPITTTEIIVSRC